MIILRNGSAAWKLGGRRKNSEATCLDVSRMGHLTTGIDRRTQEESTNRIEELRFDSPSLGTEETEIVIGKDPTGRERVCSGLI